MQHRRGGDPRGDCRGRPMDSISARILPKQTKQEGLDWLGFIRPNSARRFAVFGLDARW